MSRKNKRARIRIHPDPILKEVCKDVETGEDVQHVIKDMLYILSNSKTGVGLAAPQAGHLKRVIAISIKGFYRVMINPVILESSGALDLSREWCLSYPGVSKLVNRYRSISVQYTDEKGDEISKEFSRFTARVIQHEMDHLNGKCILGVE